MRTELVLLILLVIIGILLEPINSEEHPPEEFFTFKLNDIRGQPFDFSQFKGKVTLLVNTASQSSQTETQLKSLKRLYDILSHGSRFNVLAFPCNEFGDQEPWEALEIEEYYRGHFKIEFPILEKGSVAESPLWSWVAAQANAELPVDNFHKYLIDGTGKIVKSWNGEVSIEKIFDDVQELVNLVRIEEAVDVDENIVQVSGENVNVNKEEL